MKYDTKEFRTEVLLSFQQALIDGVTPELRAVTVAPLGPMIRAEFVYETNSEQAEEILTEVEAYVAADFDASVDVDFRLTVLPVDERLQLAPGAVWVFRRREQPPE